MKTLIIYNDLESEMLYFIIEGDYSKFNGVCLNSGEEPELEDECDKFLFNQENGDFLYTSSTDSKLIENKDWDKIAIVNLIP